MKEFWRDALTLAIKTAASTAIAVIGVSVLIHIVNWDLIVSTVVLATVFSLLIAFVDRIIACTEPDGSSIDKHQINKVVRVMLDPGHGGSDPGAVGPTGLLEKDINLLVAKSVAAILAPVAAVKLTRDTDMALGANVNADLTARANAANAWGADIYVSIHCNSAANSSATGTETFYYTGSTPGAGLAKAIQTRIAAAVSLPDRGVKTGNFAVLRQTNMPACLTEIGFISNPAEEAMLKSPVFQALMAGTIADGIAAYLGLKLPAPGAGPDSAVSPWAKESWEKAVAAGLFDGTNPQGALSREQAAIVFDRLGLIKA